VILATCSEMRKAFLRNTKAASALQGSHETCRGLLVFYGVECGLKYLLMTENGYKDTAKVGKRYTHDLLTMIRELRLAPSELTPTPQGAVPPKTVSCLMQYSTRKTLDFSELHQAWRYGIDIEEPTQLQILVILDHLKFSLTTRIEGRRRD